MELDSIEVKAYTLGESNAENDSTIVQADTVWNISYQVKKTYHNDRSIKEIGVLEEYLQSQGISQERYILQAVRKNEDEVEDRYLLINYKK